MLIHIGYHKTGTKWVQRSLIAVHPQLVTPWSMEDVSRHLIACDPLSFDPASTTASFKAAWERVDPDRVPVISFERLSGSPHAGGYDSKEIADRLQQSFPEARVWIAIRNQPDMIVSNYKQYLRMGGTLPPQRYLAGTRTGAVPSFRFRFFEYDHLLKHYVDLFGRENVLITLYEDLARDPLGLAGRLCDFVGVRTPELSVRKVHPSFTDLQCRVIRRLNLFAESPHGLGTPLIPLIKRKRLFTAVAMLRKPPFPTRDGKVTKTIRRLVQAHAGVAFAASNRRLESELGIVLSSQYPR